MYGAVMGLRGRTLKMLARTLILWLLCLPASWAASMTELNYRDQDPGAAPYLTRILVSKGYMRIDHGKDGGDYLLLDRAARRVYNVMRGAGEVMRIDAGKVSLAKPAPWTVREAVTDLPRRGKGARQVKLYVNNELCSTSIAVQGAFPDAVAALREYRETLAAVQARTFRATPRELRDPCQLAQYVFDVGRGLKYGLPLNEVSHDGRSRHMLSYRTVKLRPELFRVPQGLRRLNIDHLHPRPGDGDK